MSLDEWTSVMVPLVGCEELLSSPHTPHVHASHMHSSSSGFRGLCHLLPGSQRAPGTSVFFLSFGFPSLEAGGVWGLKGMAKTWRRAPFGCFLWQARELAKNTSTDGKANIQAGQMLPKFAPNKEVGEIATPTSSQRLSPELAWNPDKITSLQSRARR